MPSHELFELQSKSYKNKILNIHPSLLPAFPGAQAHRDTLNYGAKIGGCTAHLVDNGIDSGPVSYTHLTLPTNREV